MSQSFTFVDWTICSIAVLVVVLAIYTHAEGNRISAIKFTYDDISREMGGHSRIKVWWRAINIAMGWQTKRGLTQQHRASAMRKASHS